MAKRQHNCVIVIIGDGFGEKQVRVTKMQFRLFKALVREPDCFISYEALCEAVLGHVPAKKTWTIRQHAWYLREKLKAEGIDCIFSQRGMRTDKRDVPNASGYRWRMPLSREQKHLDRQKVLT